MNATTTIESTALSLPERAAVAMRTSACEISLMQLVTNASSIVTVTNVDGHTEAHRALMNHVAARTGIDKDASIALADAKGFVAAVGEEKKRLTDIIKPSEDRLRGLRDGWAEKVEAEKQAKIAAEMARVAAIRARIAELRDFGADSMHGTDVQLFDAIEDLSWIKPGENWSGDGKEFDVEALGAWEKRMAQLNGARVAAERRTAAAAIAEAARIAEAAKLAADREELRLLQEAQRKQAAELAEAKRVQDAVDQKRMYEQAGEVAKFRAEQAAYATEVQRRVDALAAQQAAADARDAEAARQAKVDAAHGEGLDDNADWNAGAAFRAAFEAEGFEVETIETRYEAQPTPLAVLADVAGDEPPTDAEIIAELLNALKVALRAMHNECDIDEYAFAFADVRLAIFSAEGRTT